MQNLLGRIERQYILETLSQDLAPLSISIGTELFSIYQGSYFLCDSLIQLQTPLPEYFIDKKCSVRFYHKERLLSFFCVPQRPAGKGIFLTVPQDIFKESENSLISKVFFEFMNDQHIVRFSSLENLSVTHIIQNPLILEEKKDSIKLLSEKIGLISFTSPIAYRLFESLEWFLNRTKNRVDIKDGVLLFVDHESVLVLTEKNYLIKGFKDKDFIVSLRFDKRIVRVEGRFRGELRLNNLYCIWYFIFSDIQEEDRRFLFESCYGFRYI